jgi:hypothetical protein
MPETTEQATQQTHSVVITLDGNVLYRIGETQLGTSPELELDDYMDNYTCAHCGDGFRYFNPYSVNSTMHGVVVDWLNVAILAQTTIDGITTELFGDDWVACCSEYCYDDLRSQEDDDGDEDGVYDYGYKPTPVFHGEGTQFGIELECDALDHHSCDRQSAVDELNDLSDNHDLFYLKQDGSLDYGFEIVTHPASLEFFRTEFPWRQITETAVHYGLRGHDVPTAGLHIHVERGALGDDHDEQDMHLTRLILTLSTHWRTVERFSRRRDSRWAQLNYDGAYDKTNPVHRDKMIRAKGAGHSLAINTEHRSTYEFRIFKSSLRPSTVLASIEFVAMLIEYVKSNDDETIQAHNWSDVIAKAGDYTYLPQYLLERKIA